MNDPGHDDEDPTVPEGPREEKEFHLWKLLAWLLGIIATLAVIAAIIDIVILGW